MQTYIGVKRVQAEPCEKGGNAGYRVIYPDGYESWSPKACFEKAYFPIEQEDKITMHDIDTFIDRSVISVNDVDDKVTLVKVIMPTGFVDIEASACVSPKNYNQDIGREIALGHIKDRLWKLMGFVLQWADHGIKRQ